MSRLLAALLLLAAAAPVLAVDLVTEDLAGIWKKCYEPGAPGVYEIDEGYLVLLPTGTYYAVGLGCCDQPVDHDVGEYETRGDGVVLDMQRHDGSHWDWELVWQPEARVVFFDEVDAEPVVTEALRPGDDLNYAFCRIYPTD
jgi:hypothetical protein